MQFRELLVDIGVLLLTLLVIGTLGFKYFGDTNWIDAFHTASHYITGLGSNTVMSTTGGKLWSSLFAILGTTLFIGIAVTIVADLLERRYVERH